MLSPRLQQRLTDAPTRLDLWTAFLNSVTPRVVAEIGVYRGTYAYAILSRCSSITTYYMIDPWRSLPHWNKPGNVNDACQDEHYRRTITKTRYFRDKLRILRGTTLEVADQIPDSSVDFCYIDGDHTLRGITTDLLAAVKKLRPGGWIGGDDFTPSIWQHGHGYEPTFVFPFAVYFAAALRLPIYGLHHCQFLLHKQPVDSATFVDLVGVYSDDTVLSQFPPMHHPAMRE